MSSDTDAVEIGTTVPYVSWTTFTGFIGRLRETAIPPEIDSSVMRGMSGSAQSQMRIALRFLGLVNGDGATTEKLVRLVNAHGTPNWPEALRDVIFEAYPRVLGDINLDNGTSAQLEARFREAGSVQGATLVKAIRFFLAAMTASNSEFSPHFHARETPRPSRKRVAKREHENGARPVVEATPRPDKDATQATDLRGKLLEKFPPFDPAWPDDIKSKWFAAYDKLLKMTPVK